MPLDKQLLLAHIKTRANAQASLVAAAVLDGLASAIVRGDFDEKEGGTTHGHHPKAARIRGQVRPDPE